MATLVRTTLQASGYPQITEVGTAAAALEAAQDADLIVLDQELPDGLGIDLVPRLISRPDPPSVIMVTGAGNEALVAAALRAGALDYLPKNARLAELPSAKASVSTTSEPFAVVGSKFVNTSCSAPLLLTWIVSVRAV